MSVIEKPVDAPAWWTEADARFKVGDRVWLSIRAKDCGVLSSRQSHTGVVVGFSRDRKSVRVRRDGMVAAENYHPDFWDVDAPPEQK